MPQESLGHGTELRDMAGFSFCAPGAHEIPRMAAVGLLPEQPEFFLEEIGDAERFVECEGGIKLFLG